MARRRLPSGTITLLFTDIEGSTRLLQELGAEAYAEALAEHRRVIRAACDANGGVEVDTQGDAFFFAFPTAQGALEAAAVFTADLAAHGQIRVRVGLHTGAPLLVQEGYVGQDVHRAARIAAAGHGGQVLVSSETAKLVEAALTDLGEHRFKDLGAPERVFQLGTGQFPALKSLFRTNLPVPATGFLGREEELAEVIARIERADARLVTLTGPGGTGKTRLALQAVAEVSDGFPGGLFWVPLAPLQDASLLETRLAQALEVGEQPGIAIADSIVSAFADKRALVLVDNCEHLVEPVARLIGQLLEGCRELVVVATSRERLGLRAEHLYEVPSMTLADSALLFLERARALSSDFEPSPEVEAICEALDGLPLAIELAAARVRSLSTAAIRERLADRLDVLASRDRDLDERQRTLEATIAWSYDLLVPEEKRVLRTLSIFAGGCTLEAAEAVAGADLDALEALLDKSLLRHRIDEAHQDRYWMLETIRAYASSLLTTAGEGEDALRRHGAHFAAAAAELASHSERGLGKVEIGRYHADRANFRSALLETIRAGDANEALRFVDHLGRLWIDLRELADNYRVASEALELEGGDDETRAYALLVTAELASALGDVDRAWEMFDEAERSLERSQDLRGLALLNAARSLLAGALGDHVEAIALAERATAQAAQTDPLTRATVTNAHAGALMNAAISEEPPDRDALHRSQSLIEEYLALVTPQGAPLREATGYANLGAIEYLLGELGAALRSSQQALRLRLAHAEDRYPDELFNIGCIGAELGLHREGFMLMARSVLTSREDGVLLHSSVQRDLELLEPLAREALGDSGYEDALRAGEALAPEKAIELALGLSPAQSSAG